MLLSIQENVPGVTQRLILPEILEHTWTLHNHRGAGTNLFGYHCGVTVLISCPFCMTQMQLTQSQLPGRLCQKVQRKQALIIAHQTLELASPYQLNPQDPSWTSEPGVSFAHWMISKRELVLPLEGVSRTASPGFLHYGSVFLQSSPCPHVFCPF